MTTATEADLPYRQFLGHRPRSASSGPRPTEAADPVAGPGEPAGAAAPDEGAGP